MSVYRKWASAETSTNLKHQEWDCQVDVLGAVGMAHIKEGYAAVFRLKYLGDAGSYPQARDQFRVWVKRALRSRRVHLPVSVNILADEILRQWLDDICDTCDGHEMQDEAGKSCSVCLVSGKKKVAGERVQVMITLDVFDRADRMLGTVGALISRCLGQK